MKPIVTLEYIKIEGCWTWKAEIKSNGENPVRATGDHYQGNSKGLKEAKRDAAAAIEHLRAKGNIKVKRKTW